jgi:single-stranded DNA-binding protein
MNSFKLTAVGCLARNPELDVGETGTFARFCLVGQDDETEDEGDGLKRDAVTTLRFFAIGKIAVEIARNARKGDQLFLEARVIANSWTERGERHRGHTFIVTGFRFGAKRSDPEAPAASQCMPPDTPQPESAQAEADEEAQDGASA